MLFLQKKFCKYGGLNSSKCLCTGVGDWMKLITATQPLSAEILQHTLKRKYMSKTEHVLQVLLLNGVFHPFFWGGATLPKYLIAIRKKIDKNSQLFLHSAEDSLVCTNFSERTDASCCFSPLSCSSICTFN